MPKTETLIMFKLPAALKRDAVRQAKRDGADNLSAWLRSLIRDRLRAARPGD